MALALGNLLGAVANARTAFSHDKSYKSFLLNISDFGVQVLHMFEVNFSGLENVTFRIQSIELPSIKINTTDIYYDGRSIPIPINYDYEHEFSMTILNDAQGYIYPAIAEFIMMNVKTDIASGGYTMTIKALTGDPNYDGSLITCKGVRLTNIGGLSFGHANTEVQTFSVSGVLQEYTVTPGSMSMVAGIAGTINSLIG